MHFSRNKINRFRAFTLIELLMVVSIISLLSSIVISAVGEAKEKAKETRALTDARQIVQAIIYAQNEKAAPLIRFAPSTNCMDCVCSDRATCINKFNDAMREIDIASGGVFNLTKIKNDPWGDVYRFDANQAEIGVAGCSAQDTMGIYNRQTNSYRNIKNFPTIPLSPFCP